ncbi:MAG: ATP synthase F1 subunit epsilon [Akkermansiaceae bacterium]
MIRLDIVTPEKKVFSDNVEDVYLPTEMGEIGVLQNHTALVTPLVPGELRYAKDGKIYELAIGLGFAELGQESISVLTDMALSAHEINETEVEKTMREAEEALDGLDHHAADEDIAQLRATIGRSLAQLKLKRR